MSRLLAALVVLVTGAASRYDPYVFQGVVAVRQSYGSLPENLPDFDGAFIAMLEPDNIGQVVLVCVEDDCRYALVADCAGIADGGYAWMVRNGVAGELDFWSYQSLRAGGKSLQIYRESCYPGIVPGRGIHNGVRRTCSTSTGVNLGGAYADWRVGRVPRSWPASGIFSKMDYEAR